VTTSNYSTIANSHTLHFTTARTVSSPVVAWYRLPTADVPFILDSRTISVPEQPASHNNSSQGLNCSSHLTKLTAQQLTSLHCTQLSWTPLIALIITRGHGPHRKYRPYVVVSIVACAAIGADCVVNTAFQAVYWRAVGTCCPGTGFVRSHHIATGLHATVYLRLFDGSLFSELESLHSLGTGAWGISP
jgi:hypothetical protein